MVHFTNNRNVLLAPMLIDTFLANVWISLGTGAQIDIANCHVMDLRTFTAQCDSLCIGSGTFVAGEVCLFVPEAGGIQIGCDCYLGNSAVIYAGCTIPDRSMVGDKSRVDEGARLTSGSLIIGESLVLAGSDTEMFIAPTPSSFRMLQVCKILSVLYFLGTLLAVQYASFYTMFDLISLVGTFNHMDQLQPHKFFGLQPAALFLIWWTPYSVLSQLIFLCTTTLHKWILLGRIVPDVESHNLDSVFMAHAATEHVNSYVLQVKHNHDGGMD